MIEAEPAVQTPPEPVIPLTPIMPASVSDPLRERLGWLGRRLPETYEPLRWKQFVQVARSVSVTRSLYCSLRLHGRCVVGRGTRLYKQRSARVEFKPGAWLLLGLHNHGSNPTVLDLGRDARLVVNGTTQIWRGTQIKVLAGGRLEFGETVIINEDAKVICFKSIKFGNLTGMSWNTTVMDSDLHPFSIGGKWIDKEAPVEFETRSFLGAGSTVLKGVRLGAGTVVAAGSVVTRDQPPRCLVGGNPARVLYEDFEWK